MPEESNVAGVNIRPRENLFPRMVYNLYIRMFLNREYLAAIRLRRVQ